MPVLVVGRSTARLVCLSQNATKGSLVAVRPETSMTQKGR